MEKVFVVRDFGQKRLLRAVFGRHFQRSQSSFGSGKDACKISWAGEGLSTPASLNLQAYWLSFLSQKKPAIVCRSFYLQKRSLFRTRIDSVARFQKTINSASVLYYSMRPKPHEQFDGCLKGLSEPVQHSDHFDKLRHPLDPSEVSSSLPTYKETFVDFKKCNAAEQAQMMPEEQMMKSRDQAHGKSEAAVQTAHDADHAEEVETIPEKKPGIFKRFHQTYKQFGKVLVAVHIFTSTIWGGLFYTTAMSGIDVEPALRWIGAGQTIISFYTMPGVGHVAVAYLLYKLATPARYMVTIGGTHMAVKMLRNLGYMQPIPKSESLRSLVKDGKTKVKAKYEEYQDRMDDMRDELKEIASKERKLK